MDPSFSEMLDTTAARALARAGIRRQHPEARPVEVEIELIARVYGSAAAHRLAPLLRAPRG